MTTTTTTTEFRSSHPNHVRRNVVAAFAAAAILASTAVGVGRINNGDSPRVASATNESTLGITQMNAAFWAYTPPEINPAVGVTSHPHLVANEAPSEACASGYPEACPFAHTWVAATPLQGLGDILAGLVGQR